MSARTRRSLTFFWTALFLCSLLMQYASFAAAPPVAAVHNDGVFELDGNAVSSAAPGEDWDKIYGKTSSADGSVFITDTQGLLFTSGSKDTLDMSSNSWTVQSTPDKDDILHAYAAQYGHEAGAITVFGLDRYANNGDANVGFWFFQKSIGLGANGKFTGTRTNGDVFIVSEFTSGGLVSTIVVYEWLNGALVQKITGAECAGGGSDDVCAIANKADTAAPWSYTPKKGDAGTFPTASFFEGGVRLSTIFGKDVPCFTSFLAETRASTSTTAELKNFVLGEFNTCKPPKIATQVKQGGQNVATINKGESVVDVADLTDNSPVPTGTIDFYVCGPNASQAPDCSTGGTKVGSTKTLSAGTTTSESFTPTSTGFYCFRAEYTPDAAGSNHYVAGKHTNKTTECFEVIPAAIDVSKTADNGTVTAGGQIGFVVSIKSNGPGTAFGVKVSDTLPTNTGLNWSIDAANTTGTWTISSGVLSFGGANGVSMPKDAEYHVHIVSPTTAATCGKVDNTADATSSNDGTDSASASVTVQCPDLSVEKTPDGGSVNAGSSATFTIVVTNHGPGTATGVTLTDDLPAGYSWTVGGPDGASCSIDTAANPDRLSCNFGSLAQGATKTVTLSAPTSAQSCDTINNTASVSGTNEGTNRDNNTDSGSIDVLCASIDIEKSANPAGPVNAGDEIGFDIVVTNNGDGAATNVEVTDNLPAGIAWTADAPTGDTTGVSCSIAAGVLTCTDASMAAGDSFTVHIHGTTDAADCGQVDNTASVTTGNDGSDEDSASVVVNCPDLEVVKEGNGPLNAGDDATFTITVTNHGPGTAYDVTLADELPAGSWTVGGADAADCAIDASNLLTCDFGDLADGASASVTVTTTTTADDCGQIVNAVSVEASNEDTATDQYSNVDDAEIEVNCPDLEVVKNGNGPLSAGQPAIFTITVTNHGPGAAYDVTLEDQLPAGSWTLDGPDASACDIDGSNLLTCDFGDLADGDSAVITLTRLTTAADCAGLHNEVSVAASNENTETDQYPNSDDADIVVRCPDLQVVKTGSDPVSAGENTSFSIVVTNLGPGTAFDVTLEDELPAGIAWVLGGPDADDCSISEGVLGCDFGTLAPQATRTVTLTGETDAADCGEIPNSATVGASNEPDNLLDNNESSATNEVECADIVITKTADDPVVNATDEIGFTITVTNTGDGTAFGVTVTDTLPTDAGLSWSIDPAVEGCSIAAGVLTCDFGSLASGASKSVHISSPTTAETCGTVDNLAAVTTSNDGSDDDSSSVEVLCADIAIEKTADDDVVVAGAQIGFTITVTNNGEGDAYDVEVTDELPGGFAWAIDGQANGFSIGQGALTFGPADLAAGESVSVHIVAATTAEDCGVVDNTASVTTSNDGSDEASDSVAVRCPGVDLTKDSDDEDGIVGHGQTVTFTINVTVDEGPVTNAVVTDELPEGQTYVAGTQATSPAAKSFEVSADGRTLTWTWDSLAEGAQITYDVTIDEDAPTGDQTNVAEVCVSEVEGCAGDDETVTVPELTIDKSFTGNTGGEGPGGIPEAKVGDILTYTLAYDLTNGPVHNGVITDVLPTGLAYVEGSATGNAEFSFTSFDAGTRTLRWDAPLVSDDGTVTYQVLVLTGSDELPQPLVNVATIDSDETDEDNDDEQVYVEPVPAGETATPNPPSPTPQITLPPTSTLDNADHGTSNPGFSLMLVLLGLAGFVLAVGFITPVPERARRRERR